MTKYTRLNITVREDQAETIRNHPELNLSGAVQKMIDEMYLPEELGLVELDMGNLGTEIWLCRFPDAARAAFQSSGQIDDAADAAGDCIVLQAHWGNEIIDSAGWRANTIAKTRTRDVNRVKTLLSIT